MPPEVYEFGLISLAIAICFILLVPDEDWK